jgi:hypothetical protein
MTEPDAEAILDEIFKRDAQYQGGIIKTGSRIQFYRRHLCTLLYNAFDSEYRRGVREMADRALNILDNEGYLGTSKQQIEEARESHT